MDGLCSSRIVIQHDNLDAGGAHGRLDRRARVVGPLGRQGGKQFRSAYARSMRGIVHRSLNSEMITMSRYIMTQFSVLRVEGSLESSAIPLDKNACDVYHT